ncbi:acyl-CoA dehydrogenase family member 11-like [Oscarella lobularis]|uniref:acyl-CoA dehydrogenase family member 11-like n=1 Tax=Oscarella lobularis TaxID=121494 RepID=UPI0033139A2A
MRIGIGRAFSARRASTAASASRIGTFFQDAPTLGNQYKEDAFLQAYLKRTLPSDVLADVSRDLSSFGRRVVFEVMHLGRRVELDPPRLEQYDAWGKRVDRVIVNPAWNRLHDIAAEEGLIEIAYTRLHGPWSRLHQMSKLYLFGPSSGLYSCPLAMTDGAAKVIESSGNMSLFHRAYPHLTSRLPENFWTSGQWMTERKGGSDVASGTETVAVSHEDGSYRLYGYKWFTSASDADMSLTLARIQDEGGQVVDGTKGLTLFYLETRDKQGQLNGIEIQKLKNKLGTRQLPTAEMLLDGSVAHKLSDVGRGVAAISDMLTITRLHNSIAAVGGIRRIVHLARDYAKRRSAFGGKLINHPLHVQTLARLELETRGGLILTMEIAKLLGMEENGKGDNDHQLLMRLLTPLAKLYTAKQAVSVTSEGLECFGGQGYIEDTGLPGMLRDAQVLPIWEGTTNVLSLDVLRAFSKSKGDVYRAYCADVNKRLALAKSVDPLQASCRRVQNALDTLTAFISQAASEHPSVFESAARDLAYSLARVYIGSLLIEHAAWSEAEKDDIAAAERWCRRRLAIVVSVNDYGDDAQSIDKNMVFS